VKLLTIIIRILLVTTPLVSILTNKSSISVLEAHNTMLVAKQDVHNSNHKAVSDKFDNIYKKLTKKYS